jgi:hypothetical protein
MAVCTVIGLKKISPQCKNEKSRPVIGIRVVDYTEKRKAGVVKTAIRQIYLILEVQSGVDPACQKG